MWSEGISGAEILHRLETKYGDRTMSRRGVHEWIETFQSKRTKLNFPNGKVMFTDFWDSRGFLLEYDLEKFCTMNSARCSDSLVNTLKPTIRMKQRGLLSQKVLLLRGNTRLYSALLTVETITTFSL